MTTAIDFKKIDKTFYNPGKEPGIVDVPEMHYLAVDGAGDPNTSPEYMTAVEILYALAYTIKMSKKGDWQPEGYVDFVVPPLEGFWCVTDADKAFDGRALADKSQLTWTSVIRVPEFVTEDVLAWAKSIVARKHPEMDVSRADLFVHTEGVCAQIMHIGPFDDEPATVERMDAFAEASGYRVDFTSERRHHEIYLSDPRRTAPEKMKTVIRHPLVAD